MPVAARPSHSIALPSQACQGKRVCCSMQRQTAVKLLMGSEQLPPFVFAMQYHIEANGDNFPLRMVAVTVFCTAVSQQRPSCDAWLLCSVIGLWDLSLWRQTTVSHTFYSLLLDRRGSLHSVQLKSSLVDTQRAQS